MSVDRMSRGERIALALVAGLGLIPVLGTVVVAWYLALR